MDEVVTSDGESVAVTADLPDAEFGVGQFDAGGNGRSTSVNGVHAISGHIVGQTA